MDFELIHKFLRFERLFFIFIKQRKSTTEKSSHPLFRSQRLAILIIFGQRISLETFQTNHKRQNRYSGLWSSAETGILASAGTC